MGKNKKGWNSGSYVDVIFFPKKKKEKLPGIQKIILPKMATLAINAWQEWNNYIIEINKVNWNDYSPPKSTEIKIQLSKEKQSQDDVVFYVHIKKKIKLIDISWNLIL